MSKPRLRRRDRLRERLYDRIEDAGHHFIDWLPLAASAAFTVVLDIARRAWLADSDELGIRMVRGAILVMELGSLVTMVGPKAVEAVATLTETTVRSTQRVRRLWQRDAGTDLLSSKEGAHDPRD